MTTVSRDHAAQRRTRSPGGNTDRIKARLCCCTRRTKPMASATRSTPYEKRGEGPSVEPIHRIIQPETMWRYSCGAPQASRQYLCGKRTSGGGIRKVGQVVRQLTHAGQLNRKILHRLRQLHLKHDTGDSNCHKSPPVPNPKAMRLYKRTAWVSRFTMTVPGSRSVC